MLLTGAAPMNDEVIGRRVSVDKNQVFSEKIEVKNGMLVGKQHSTSSVGDDTKCNGVTEDEGRMTPSRILVQDSISIPQQQPQGPHIRWERFLPLRSLTVLLVEDDDSTRHVVSALLRNCSYDVTAVSNGLQAWKYLESPSSQIDLILTEVAMPFFSGIHLLSKIMNHKSLKNIPVIMMSSQDSMGIVFNCLSKGAVDFLVKPIRKNELKNLWQHVWRRCHSSSGSGSESGTQCRKFVKSKSNEASDNNTASNDAIDFESDDICIRDGTDDGSGTQSSWTKVSAEVDSLHRVSPCGQLADAPDSICAQVIHTKPGKVCNRWVHSPEVKDDEHVGAAGFKDLDLQLDNQSDKMSIKPLGDRIKQPSDADGKLGDGHGNEGEKGKPGCEISGTERNLVLDVSTVVHFTNQESIKREIDPPTGFSHMLQAKISVYSEELPSLELTLKGREGAADVQDITGDDHKVLRHSNLSAFTRYNNASSPQQAQMGHIGSCSSLKETMQNFPSRSNGIYAYQRSNGIEDNNDMVSTNRHNNSKVEAFDKGLESVTGIRSFYSGCSEPLKDGSSLTQQMITVKAEGSEMGRSQPRSLDFQIKRQHQLHSFRQQLQRVTLDAQSDNDGPSQKSMARAAEQCVSSNGFGGNAYSNAGNYSVNGSASGSDQCSNGQKGSCTGLTTEMVYLDSDNGAAGSSVGAVNMKSSVTGTNEGRVALREAALTKFRQKRKERCFEKKVRYHSRKKLAEQRPRVRGQFVKKKVSDDREENCLSNGQVSNDNSHDDTK